jgi:histidine ammonia-lyase
LQQALSLVRARIPAYTEDRFFAPDIEAAIGLVNDGSIAGVAPDFIT